MRIALILAVFASVTCAHANELDGVKGKMAGCLLIPIQTAVEPFTVTFEIILEKAAVKDVKVVDYQPHNQVMANALPVMANFIKTCWPAGIRTSPHRLTYSLLRPLLFKPISFPDSYELTVR